MVKPRMFIFTIVVMLTMLSMAPGAAAALTIEDLFHDLKARAEAHYGGGIDRHEITFSMDDWSADVTRFARVEMNDLPILERPGFGDARLQLLGFAHIGEIFELIGTNRTSVLVNPLSPSPDGNGAWYHVKFVNGDSGWIMGRADAMPERMFASIINRTTSTSRRAPPVVTIASIPAPSASGMFDGIDVIWIPIAALVMLGFVAMTVMIGGSNTSDSNDPTPSVPVTRDRMDQTSGGAAVANLEQLQNALTRFHAEYPTLPAIPIVSMEYNGWFGEISKRHQIEQLRLTAAEQTQFLEQVHALHTWYRKIAEERFEIGRIQAKATLEDLRLQKDLKQAAQDLAVQDVERDLRTTELEARRKKLQLEIAQCNAEIEKIKNPPPPLAPPEKPKPKSHADVVTERTEKIQAFTSSKQRELDGYLKAHRVQSRDDLDEKAQDLFDEIANHWDAKMSELYQ